MPYRGPPPPDPLEEIGQAFEGIGRAWNGAMDAIGSAVREWQTPETSQPQQQRRTTTPRTGHHR